MKKKMLARYPIGNPDRKWKQDNFILSVATPGPMGLAKQSELHKEKARRAVETAVDAGFNLMELIWASPEVGMEIVKTAERLGTKVLYQNLRRFGHMGYSKERLNEENDLLGTIRDMSCWDSIMGYTMYDEPITSEHTADCRNMIEIGEKENPDKLYFVVADRFHIEQIAQEINPPQLSFDIYPFGNVHQLPVFGEQLDKSKLWYCLALAHRTAKSIHAPFWFYYQGHELFYEVSPDKFTFTAARMMANAALLYGAKQLGNYNELAGVFDPETGGRGFFFEEQKELNREISALGNTLMALDCLRVIHDDSVTIGADVEKELYYMSVYGGVPMESDSWEKIRSTMEDSELLTGKLPHRLSVSELTDAYGNRYLMALNRDYERDLHYCLTLKENSRVYRVNHFNGEQSMILDGEQHIFGYLKPGCIALYRIQSMDEEPYLIEYYLEKGQA